MSNTARAAFARKMAALHLDRSRDLIDGTEHHVRRYYHWSAVAVRAERLAAGY